MLGPDKKNTQNLKGLSSPPCLGKLIDFDIQDLEKLAAASPFRRDVAVTFQNVGASCVGLHVHVWYETLIVAATFLVTARQVSLPLLFWFITVIIHLKAYKSNCLKCKEKQLI